MATDCIAKIRFFLDAKPVASFPQYGDSLNLIDALFCVRPKIALGS